MRRIVSPLCAALCAAVLLIGAAFAESAAGLKWTAPTGWVSQSAATFRVVTWKVQDAECIVYFFGPGQGGGVQANLDRWKGQFSQNGKPAEAKITRRTIHGVPMTTIDLSGTYTATGGQVEEGQGPQPGYRMIATVAEGKGGNLFIRFIGPQKTVTAELPKYEQLLSSFQPE
ncbi:MAG TPA: hypothetical protein VG273_28520 [Bryobacteraceae bacterium]|jgi:hypothetical protein|nr:hypothetical protein [Bryobacteraceae bacterium]